MASSVPSESAVTFNSEASSTPSTMPIKSPFSKLPSVVALCKIRFSATEASPAKRLRMIGFRRVCVPLSVRFVQVRRGGIAFRRSFAAEQRDDFLRGVVRIKVRYFIVVVVG